MNELPTCRWGRIRVGDRVQTSNYCDDEHPIEVYLVRPRGQREATPTELCRYHGQYWPKEGETEAAARLRTRTARARIGNRSAPGGTSAQRSAGWSRSRPIEEVAEV